MDIEVLSILLLLAASAGALLTLLALGYFRRREAVQEAIGEGIPDGPQPRGRPGAGPAFAWFVKGGGRLGAIRYERCVHVVKALAKDLEESRDLSLEVGIRKKRFEEIRRLPWPQNEAVFLARPMDPFLILIDRPLEVFDPRYDRYLIVPVGFMEAAGGVEAFMGALAYDVLANQRPPLDVGESLLRDAAEAALAAGFAPPDVFKAMVQMLRQQVFAGRYRPYLSMPGDVPGAGRRAPVQAPTGPEAPPEPIEAPGAGPAAPGNGPVPPEPPPLSQPAAPKAPPDGKKPPKRKK